MSDSYISHMGVVEMKASLTKLYTVSIASAHSLSAFCRFASPFDVKRVLRQLHGDKRKADNPFSLDTLHLHHFSVTFSSFSAREHRRRQMSVQKSGPVPADFPNPSKVKASALQLGQCAHQIDAASKHRIEASKHLSISHARSCG